MNASQAIQCIAGELWADPAEIFELIQSEPELTDSLKAFLADKIDYDTLRDTVAEYCQGAEMRTYTITFLGFEIALELDFQEMKNYFLK